MSHIEEANLMPTTEHSQATVADTSQRPVSSLRLNPSQSRSISPMSQIEETNPMPTAEHPQAAADISPRPVSRLSQNPPESHTHVQQVA
jgi:hypothetical protein